MNTNTLAITLDNFQQAILQDAKGKLVLVDFWAEQIPESIELRDKLTFAVNGMDDIIVHATVDCQTQQQIAGQFGVKALPTVVMLKDGQPVDGLTGPQTDESINTFLAKYLPKPEDNLLLQAQNLLAENNANEASGLIKQAYAIDSERADIKLVLADVCIQTGQIEEASNLLTTIKMVDQDSYYQAVIAKLELASEAANSPEIQALEEQLAQSPDNAEIQQQLAAQYSQVNRNEEALAMLFRLVQKDGSDAKSKDLLLDILKALPDGDALVNKYRRKLYTLMY